METIRNKLPMLHQNQAQKDVAINKTLTKLDLLLNNLIHSKSEYISHQDYEENTLYIVSKDSKAEWEGKEDCIAYFDGEWNFIQPSKGMVYYILKDKGHYYYNGTGWERL